MSSLKDGLGFEEVTNDANLLTDSQDGYFHNVSGANAQFTGSIISALSITTDAYSTSNHSTNVYGSTVISGASIKGTTITNDNGILQSVSIGSGIAIYGAKIQAGSITLSAGSVGWIVYPVAYTGTP